MTVVPGAVSVTTTVCGGPPESSRQREAGCRAGAHQHQEGGDESDRTAAGAQDTRRLVVHGRSNEPRRRVVLQQRLAQAAYERLGAWRPGVGTLGKSTGSTASTAAGRFGSTSDG